MYFTVFPPVLLTSSVFSLYLVHGVFSHTSGLRYLFAHFIAYKLLGAFSAETISFDHHTYNITKKRKRSLNRINKAKNFLPQPALKITIFNYLTDANSLLPHYNPAVAFIKTFFINFQTFK
jgi:hypothetical protein